MKILINGLQIGKNNSGVQYYTKNLFKVIQKIQPSNLKIQLYHSNTNPRFPFPHILFSSTLDLVFRLLFPFKGRLSRIFNENFLLPAYLRHNKYDLYHSPNYVLPYFINFPSIITVHDLIIFDFPKLCQTESVMYFKLFLPRSIKKANKIITVSETAKMDIINQFNISENKIAVIQLGVSNIFRRIINPDILLNYSITNNFILFVGNIEPKKNLVRLIKAYHKLISEERISHQLVIAGKKGWKYKEVFNTVQKLELQDKVIFTGYVPEDHLPVLYSMADLFAFPSIYEGFGIPPLEAMACETAVLASNTGALPETTGGNCLMVDPYDVDDIADGMYKLLTDHTLRKRCVENGKKWVEQFTWERAARKTLDVYKQIKAESEENVK
jgi:glycosyltransferase involved in cell wall biosynthesis